MFYPFKPDRRPRQSSGDAGTDQLATRIFHKSLKLQRKCADYLSEKAKKLPGKTLKTTLIAMAIAAGSYCLFLIACGVLGKPAGHVFQSVITERPTASQAATRQAKEQVFNAYLDSLEKAFIRDSINESNPKK